MKIAKFENLLGTEQYHVILGERGDEYITTYGWMSEERCKEEYEFCLKHNLPTKNCLIPKLHIRE